MLGGKQKMKESLIEKTHSNDQEEEYIFYNNHQEKKFQQQIEIQAILNSNNLQKVMVIIDRKSSLNYLSIKIAEQMEKFSEFSNLEGLKAINLTKKTEKGIIKIPSSGEIKDHITGGEIIYCDLNTQEYWIKTHIKIYSSYSKMVITLDLKFRIETIFKKLKFLLLKLGINFWMDYSKNKDDPFHYAFINAKFKTCKSKNNFEFNINDLNKSNQIESSNFKF
jgi:hypothetical protein